jgi:hypothetical protein
MHSKLVVLKQGLDGMPTPLMQLTSVFISDMKWEQVGVGRILRKQDTSKSRLPHFVIQSQILVELG